MSPIIFVISAIFILSCKHRFSDVSSVQDDTTSLACDAQNYVPSGFLTKPSGFKLIPRCFWKKQLPGSPIETFFSKEANKHDVPIRALVVHHSAIPVTADNVATRLEPTDENSRSATEFFKNVAKLDSRPLSTQEICMRQLHYFSYLHTQVAGFADLAYNYLICPDGSVFEGRVGGDFPETRAPDGTVVPAQTVFGRDVRGSHVSLQNNGTLGINLMGQFSREPAVIRAQGGQSEMTIPQKAALIKVVAWLAKEYALKLDQKIPNPDALLARFSPVPKSCETQLSKCLVAVNKKHTCSAETLKRCNLIPENDLTFKDLTESKRLVKLMTSNDMFPLTTHIFMGLHRHPEGQKIDAYHTECPGELEQGNFMNDVRLEALKIVKSFR